MSEQYQCPNCGGYKTSFSIEPIMRTEEVPYADSIPARIRRGLILGIMGGISIGLMASLVGGELNYGLQFGFIVFLVANLIAFLGKEIRSEKLGEYYKLYCQICGYKWEWIKGQPWPAVTVQTDLIAKGSQRLEEEAQARAAEEEERKKRDFINLSQRLGKQ